MCIISYCDTTVAFIKIQRMIHFLVFAIHHLLLGQFILFNVDSTCFLITADKTSDHLSIDWNVKIRSKDNKLVPLWRKLEPQWRK